MVEGISDPRVQIAYHRLPEEERSSYGRAVKALQERFELAIHKHRYFAELYSTGKRGHMKAEQILQMT